MLVYNCSHTTWESKEAPPFDISLMVQDVQVNWLNFHIFDGGFFINVGDWTGFTEDPMLVSVLLVKCFILHVLTIKDHY